MNWWLKLRLCWRILTLKRSNLIAHAETELRGASSEWGDMEEDLISMVMIFSSQGHSGFSAQYAISILERLLRYKPLRPLTGEPSEWNEVGPGVWQNKRCSHVFKSDDRFDGKPYDIQAVVWEDSHGLHYTNYQSARVISFPYDPSVQSGKIEKAQVSL